MWAKVDDHFDEHKKVYIAGERLGGPNATGRVLAIWLEGRLWSNRNNTLGFVPLNIVKRFKHDDDPLQVAGALSAPLTDDERVRWNTDSESCLWTAEPGGYRFHDDEHYRPKADPEHVSRVRSEAGRRGGLASAATRKLNPKQTASDVAVDDAQKPPPIDRDEQAPLKQSGEQNFNPVSRFPDPGTSVQTPQTHTPRGRANRGTLVTPPAQQRNIRYFSQIGLNVPNLLHDTEFRPRLMGGGISATAADAKLDAWYPTVEANFAGQVVGDEPFQFWRKRFAEWIGTTAKQTTAVIEQGDTVGDVAKRKYGSMRFGE